MEEIGWRKFTKRDKNRKEKKGRNVQRKKRGGGDGSSSVKAHEGGCGNVV